MREYTTISVKIPIADREEMRRLKIKPSLLVRMAIKRKLKKERVLALMALRKKMGYLFEKLPADAITANIRADRDSR